MDNKTIQSLIYNQLYAGSMYNYMASLTTDEKQKSQLLAFKADSYNNARYLERYYEELNTSSFNPIINQPHQSDTFYESILWMIEYNGRSSRLFINQAFNDVNDDHIQNITSYINSVISQHNALLTQIYLQQNFYVKKTSLP